MALLHERRMRMSLTLMTVVIITWSLMKEVIITWSQHRLRSGGSGGGSKSAHHTRSGAGARYCSRCLRALAPPPRPCWRAWGPAWTWWPPGPPCSPGTRSPRSSPGTRSPGSPRAIERQDSPGSPSARGGSPPLWNRKDVRLHNGHSSGLFLFSSGLWI